MTDKSSLDFEDERAGWLAILTREWHPIDMIFASREEKAALKALETGGLVERHRADSAIALPIKRYRLARDRPVPKIERATGFDFK